MKNDIVFLFFILFSINNIFGDDYDILNICNTGYYLSDKKREYDPWLKTFVELPEYKFFDRTIIQQTCYLLYFSWDKGDNKSYGIIYFSDSSQSDFFNILYNHAKIYNYSRNGGKW
jgi:hypothetical protein